MESRTRAINQPVPARMDAPLPGMPVTRRPARPLARLLRSAAIVPSFALLAACAGTLSENDTPDSGELLRHSLPVAAAALAAGQLDVARRLYLSLAERFQDAPEPALGLGYIAFYNDDLPSAQRYFLQSADLADDRPAMQSEALLGGGRAALARGRTPEARQIFRNARDLGHDAPSAPWISNGLAVAAALDADYEAAEAHYTEAIRLSSGDARITANFVRMLIAAGRIADASRLYATHPPSYWAEEDSRILSRLIEESRQERRDRGATSPPAAGSDTASNGSRARVGIPGETTHDHPGRDLSLRLVAAGPPPAPSVGSEEATGRIGFTGPLLSLLDSSGASVPPLVDGDPPRVAFHMPSFSPVAGAASDSPLLTDGAAAGDGPARASPPPGLGESVSEIPDHLPSANLTLTLGQARRLQIGYPATAVSVAAPGIADVQLLAPDVLYVIGRGVGRTSIVVRADGQWIEERIVSVELDLDPLHAVLADEPDLHEVRARPLARGMVLTGEVRSAEAADRALRIAAATLPEGLVIENELRIGGPQQVNLEVQVAEVNRSVTENLGVSWEWFGLGGSERFGARVGRFLPIGDDGLTRGAFPPALLEGTRAPSLFFGNQGSDGVFRIMIDALATAGLANVLARPNMTAVSGESASFFSGGEFPLPLGFDDGVLVFEYKKYGVLLDFVPTVVDADRIVLTVRPEVSEPSLNRSVRIIQGIEVPVINVRRAETTVEVGNGESIVIAGLFRNDSNTVESGLPGLKDVPLLGVLFGTTSARSDEVELIVVVTARLVHARTASDPDDQDPAATSRRASGYHY